MTDTGYQPAKQIVRDFHEAIETADVADVEEVLTRRTCDDYQWRGVHPFNELHGAGAVADSFWRPFKSAFSALQRREDIFFAGDNYIDDGASCWVVSMGHFMGLFDQSWLDVPPTRRLTLIPYAEFACVRDAEVTESAMFVDIIRVMRQAGCYPLAPSTGAEIFNPGPRTSDGICIDARPRDEGEATLELVNRMIADLSALNKSGDDRCPPELLEKTWHTDMAWYGPSGVGATFTVPRYQQQHQYPFRTQLKDKVFNGHVARLAEGNYAGFFGWANLTNTPTGGFLGLPGNEVRAEMRVVDIYRRHGNKLAENWVFIDLLHWMNMQGLDVLARMREQLPA